MDSTLYPKSCIQCSSNYESGVLIYLIRNSLMYCVDCFSDLNFWEKKEPSNFSNILCPSHHKDLDFYCYDCKLRICCKCLLSHQSHSLSEIDSLDMRKVYSHEAYNKNLNSFKETVSSLSGLVEETKNYFEWSDCKESISAADFLDKKFDLYKKKVVLKNEEEEILNIEIEANLVSFDINSELFSLVIEKKALKSRLKSISEKIARDFILFKNLMSSSKMNQLSFMLDRLCHNE